jgi:hypothetical protein
VQVAAAECRWQLQSAGGSCRVQVAAAECRWQLQSAGSTPVSSQGCMGVEEASARLLKASGGQRIEVRRRRGRRSRQ